MTVVVGYVRTPEGEAALAAAVEQLNAGERLIVVNKPEPGEARRRVLRRAGLRRAAQQPGRAGRRRGGRRPLRRRRAGHAHRRAGDRPRGAAHRHRAAPPLAGREDPARQHGAVGAVRRAVPGAQRAGPRRVAPPRAAPTCRSGHGPGPRQGPARRLTDAMTTTGDTVEHGDAAPDDTALLAAHVAGDPDAFGELVRRHRDRLWAVALRTTADPEEASDALQDAFISAYRNAASFRGEAAVTTWLHRVVVNACLDRMRRRKARPTVPLPEEDGETGAPRHRRPARRPRPPRAPDGDRQGARRAPRSTSAPRSCWSTSRACSVADAAVALGVPEGTVKSRCSRGRARLAVALAGLRNPDAGSGVPSQAGRPEHRRPTATRPTDPEVSCVTDTTPGAGLPDERFGPRRPAPRRPPSRRRTSPACSAPCAPTTPRSPTTWPRASTASSPSCGAPSRCSPGAASALGDSDDAATAASAAAPSATDATVLPLPTQRRESGTSRTFRWVAGAAAAVVVLGRRRRGDPRRAAERRLVGLDDHRERCEQRRRARSDPVVRHVVQQVGAVVAGSLARRERRSRAALRRPRSPPEVDPSTGADQPAAATEPAGAPAALDRHARRVPRAAHRRHRARCPSRSTRAPTRASPPTSSCCPRPTTRRASRSG